MKGMDIFFKNKKSLFKEMSDIANLLSDASELIRNACNQHPHYDYDYSLALANLLEEIAPLAPKLTAEADKLGAALWQELPGMPDDDGNVYGVAEIRHAVAWMGSQSDSLRQSAASCNTISTGLKELSEKVHCVEVPDPMFLEVAHELAAMANELVRLSLAGELNRPCRSDCVSDMVGALEVMRNELASGRVSWEAGRGLVRGKW